jgi:hypothetical protein
MTASTAGYRPVQRRNGLGRSALVLGVVGIVLGLFAGITWFVVVPLGLLTLIVGVFGVSQQRYYVGSDATTAIIGTIAGAITLALGVWGTGTFLDNLHQAVGAALTDQPAAADQPVTAGPAAIVGGPIVAWGQPHELSTNVVVAVSAPAVFTPAVANGAARSVVLTVTITNRGGALLHPKTTVLDPAATFDGRPLSQIAVPGSTTVTVPQLKPIQPGQSVGYRVAYALPRPTGQLRLALRSAPDAAPAVIGGPT